MINKKNIVWLGWCMLLLMLAVALFAPVLAPYDPYSIVGEIFERPSEIHWLGTNDIGQDIFSELIYGARTSLFVGFLSALISLLIAVIVGVCSAWFGGWVDDLLMKISTFFITIPFIPALIILAAFVKPDIWKISFMLGGMSWAGVARIIRSETMQIKANDHVLVIQAMGASNYYILTRHVIGNLLPVIIYRFSGRFRSSILSESSLAFLGLGNVTTKSWGSIIYYAQNRNALLTGAWIWWIIPAGFCICFVSFALVLVGYSVEEIIDRRHGN